MSPANSRFKPRSKRACGLVASFRALGACALFAASAGLVICVSLDTAQAQPAMGGRPDPRQMSGLSRLDPQVAPGTITARCLLGGFDQPAVGVEVTLELRAADGRTKNLTSLADGEGRATFTGAEEFVGGDAIASVSFDGELVRSQPIEISASAGSRVLLVKGAPSAPASAPPGSVGPAGPAGPAGQGGAGLDRAGFPEPGKPFSDPRFPKGTLVVGVLDLAARGGVEGISVQLTIRPPVGEGGEAVDEIVRTGVTDAQGRVLFDKLDGDDVPAGSVLVASAVIEEGGARQASQEFTMGDVGLALVFTLGSAEAQDLPGSRAQRRPIMPPRLTPTMKAGSVRISVIDAADQPVAQQEVDLAKLDVTGAETHYSGFSGPDGVAQIEDIAVSVDAAYQITINYAGAPYRSSLFRLHESMGALAELRVFKTTDDASRIRSATQLEIAARENDLAQVTQLYQVFVSGDEAYWPGQALKIEGGEGALGFVVMNRASPIVEHSEKAPFATLREPIPPGEVVDLSFAYLVEHDGAATIRWAPPLPLLESGVLLPKKFRLSSGASKPATPPPQAPDAPFDYFDLGGREPGVPIELVVEGLPTRPRIYKDLALWLGLGMLALLGASFFVGPRRSRRDRLVERKRELVAALHQHSGEGDAAEGERRMGFAIALDQVLRQLEALDGIGGDASSGSGSGSGLGPSA